MAEPELGPSRMSSGAKAFVSTEQGRRVHFELQFVFPLKRKLYLKYCFYMTVPWYLVICGYLWVHIGVGGHIPPFFRNSINSPVVLNIGFTLKSLEGLKKIKNKKINVPAPLPRDSNIIGVGWCLKICIFKVP